MRTVGVEEELLLVDRYSGEPLSVVSRVLNHAVTQGKASADGAPEPEDAIESELQQQQLETHTRPHEHLATLEKELRDCRDQAIAAARVEGAAVASVATSPLPVTARVTANPRYERMVDRFGLTASEQLICGCHVHVSVASADEAVGVLDRIRVWLPSLLAISTNSPFWQGQDSGYASFRSQAMNRWPCAGPTEVFGSAKAYHTAIEDLVASGVLLDQGMVYFDARLSQDYPTVEIRAADVCLDLRDTILIAALCRGLVTAAAQEWAGRQPTPDVSTAMLRLATWQAGRFGIDGDLLDPQTHRPHPAAEVLAHLVDHIRPALISTGDETLVVNRLNQVLTRGTGARRQRQLLAQAGSLAHVVTDAVRVTAGGVGWAEH